MPYNRLLGRAAGRYKTRRRPLTRIQTINRRMNDVAPFSRGLSTTQYANRMNAMRNTASGMISRFLRNPRGARMGSRYR